MLICRGVAVCGAHLSADLGRCLFCLNLRIVLEEGIGKEQWRLPVERVRHLLNSQKELDLLTKAHSQTSQTTDVVPEGSGNGPLVTRFGRANSPSRCRFLSWDYYPSSLCALESFKTAQGKALLSAYVPKSDSTPSLPCLWKWRTFIHLLIQFIHLFWSRKTFLLCAFHVQCSDEGKGKNGNHPPLGQREGCGTHISWAPVLLLHWAVSFNPQTALLPYT